MFFMNPTIHSSWFPSHHH